MKILAEYALALVAVAGIVAAIGIDIIVQFVREDGD